MRSLRRKALHLLIASAVMLLVSASAYHDLAHHHIEHHSSPGCVLCIYGSAACEEAVSASIINVDLNAFLSNREHYVTLKQVPHRFPSLRAPPQNI